MKKWKETLIPPTTKDPPALGPSPFNFQQQFGVARRFVLPVE